AGPGMITDEVAPFGGFTTAPTPLESVIGALCGSIGISFAKASRDIGLGYSGIDFEASFAPGSRSPAGGQSEVGGPFDAVSLHALVHDVQPSAWLDDVGRTALRRCPVTRLLSDAGVAVEMTWSAAPPETLGRQAPQARRWPAGGPQSPSGYLPR
ncbi:MAG: OsmC family protein, partial [Trebonia sp.]